MPINRVFLYIILIVLVVFATRYLYIHYMKKKEHYSEPQREVLFFYATWCPHCTNFKPEVVKFKQQNQHNKNLQVKLLEESVCPPEMMKKYDIKGFPTVLLVFKDNAGAETVEQYNGERTSAGLQHFVDSHPHPVQQ
jgi:thiol-disulfide isomerase/thioredoxin